MKRIFRPFYFCLVLVATITSCGSQKPIAIADLAKLSLKTTSVAEKDLMRWSHLDLLRDTIPGMSVDKAYNEILKNKKGQKVIVGIVDSGVDINHDDLKSVIWTNPKEIAENGIDDDNNGYIDDVHGWNFLGDVVNEQLEMTRIVKKGPGTPEYAKAKEKLFEELKGIQEEKQQLDFLLNAEKTIKTCLLYTSDAADE
jgi:hypothetical protein